MLFQRYLPKIESLNPGKIFVENVRSLFGISRVEARTWCEMAVDGKLFEKKIGLICPSPTCNDRIIAEYNSFAEIPDEITCSLCEAEGNEDTVYKTSKLNKVEFYKLR